MIHKLVQFFFLVYLLHENRLCAHPRRAASTTELKILEDTSTKFYNADHPNLRYTGRIDYSDAKKPVFSAPGVYIRIYFTGVSCAVIFQEEFLHGRKNFYEAIVDGRDTVKISPVKGKTEYLLAKGLPRKKHEIKFVKRTESSVGKCTFLGVRIGGDIDTPDPYKNRKLMFFGNSISVGSGNEAKTLSEPCQNWNAALEFSNANKSFCAFVSKNLGAEYHINGVSGIGAARNYSSSDTLPLPAIYKRIHLADPSSLLWNFNSFIPDAIVIELGTNDFSPGDLPQGKPRPKMNALDFAMAYIHFIDALKKIYPNATIFCMNSPMLNDGWPDASDHSATDLNNSLAMVLKKFTKDEQVALLQVPKVEGKGCTTHPSVIEHQEIAAKMEMQIRIKMNWMN